MVVENNGNALVMNLRQKLLHVRKKLCVDRVACSADGGSPVGVDNKNVKRIAAAFIILNLLHRAFGGVLIVTRVPIAEKVERNELASSGQVNKVARELFIAALRHKDKNIRSLVCQIPAVEVMPKLADGIFILGGNHTGVI